jgi:PAS domain S-box-containing protein
LEYLATLGVLLIVYFLAGKLGLKLALVHANATAVWPPTGIALASLLVLGYRVWPAIFLGAFLVNITTPPGSVATSVGIACGNTFEGLLGAFLVNRFATGLNAFDHPRTVFKFAALAALASTTVSATIGVTTLSLGGLAKWGNYQEIWLTWWLGDAVGALIIAPLCVLWSRKLSLRWNRTKVLEAALLVLALVLVGQVEFAGSHLAGARNYPLTFLCIPPVVWAAFRFSQRETVTVSCLLSAIAIWGTLHGYGPFVGGTQNQSLIFLQAFMGVIAVMAMAVNAMVAEHQHGVHELRMAHDELERRVNERTAELAAVNRVLQVRREQLTEAQRVARVGSWEWDIDRNALTWSDELYRIYGLNPHETELTYERFLACVHPDDRSAVREAVERALRDHEPFSFDHRIVRPDGQERTLHGRGQVMVDPGGRPVRMIGTGQDVTEQRLAAAALSSAHDELENRVRERTAELAAANDAFMAEIVEHKRTAEALRDSRTRFQAIFENSIDAIGLSKNGVHVLANPAYLKMFGCSQTDEMTGKSVLELIAPSQRELIRERIQRRAIGADAPTHYETRGLRKDGFEFDLEVDVSSYKLKGEIYTLVILRDVTERKRADQLLKESEALKGAILESAIDCIIAMNHEGKVIEWNPAAEKTFGYSRACALGREMSELIIPPTLREKHRRGLTHYLSTGEGRVLDQRVEMTAMHADGREFPVELAISRIRRDGPPVFTGYVRDISERRRAEEMRNQLAAIVESSDDAIISKTLDGTIVSWNAGAERVFGYPAAEVVGHSITKLVPSECLDEEAQIMDRLKLGERIEHYETVRLRRDGSRRGVSLTISPLKDATGRIFGVSTIARDITERKRAEEEIRKLNAELEQRVIERTAQLEAINHELESFTYSVSHDLRAPLRAMQGLGNALLEDYCGCLDETGRDYARRIVSAAGRMETLIQDLLAYSRLSRVDLELRPVNLGQVLTEVQHQLDSEIRERHAQVSVDGELPSVIGHRATLVQVVGNLVSNGIKFVAPGVTPHVKLRADDQGERVRLWVEDNGIGVAPEYQERIFRIFERLHGVETYPGTGVGLAIVQKGVERLDGRVGVESALNCGSKFWVELRKA